MLNVITLLMVLAGPAAAHAATFRETGKTYVYEDVPREVYDALLAADSAGAYFNAYIRDCYRFREV